MGLYELQKAKLITKSWYRSGGIDDGVWVTIEGDKLNAVVRRWFASSLKRHALHVHCHAVDDTLVNLAVMPGTLTADGELSSNVCSTNL
jgi:hypothetical protein